MVVIAIIAILASMLLPALGKARDKAQAVKCTGNQKQSILGCITYANDWCDFLPKSLESDVSLTWADVLTNNNYLPYCSVRGQRTTVNCPSWIYPPAAILPLSNWKCFGMAIAKLTANPVPVIEILLSDCRRSALSVILTDHDYYQYPAGGIVGGGLEFAPRWTTKYRYGFNPEYPVQIRHSGRTNVAFADGHVEAATPNELYRIAKGEYKCSTLYYLMANDTTVRFSIP
jgi:prepilin-type processing-associated H-X9-DG protein